jgi:hypothetical protein
MGPSFGGLEAGTFGYLQAMLEQYRKRRSDEWDPCIALELNVMSVVVGRSLSFATTGRKKGFAGGGILKAALMPEVAAEVGL